MYQGFFLGMRAEELVTLGCGFPYKFLGLVGDNQEAFVVVDEGVEAKGFVVADDFVNQFGELDNEHAAAGDV